VRNVSVAIGAIDFWHKESTATAEFDPERKCRPGLKSDYAMQKPPYH
jgi:hypothetical protein